ncbi:MAG: hypothetical protein PHW63_09045 [Alphaproteobacteria bacterium]|nr:hypothetical protein [Alphaproteobacteria bacterium]
MADQQTDELLNDPVNAPILLRPQGVDARGLSGSAKAIITAVALLAAAEILLPSNGDQAIRRGYAARVGKDVQTTLQLSPQMMTSGQNYLLMDGVGEDSPVPMDMTEVSKARHDLSRVVEGRLAGAPNLPVVTLRHVDQEGVQHVVLGKPHPVLERFYQSTVLWATGAWKKVSTVTVVDLFGRGLNKKDDQDQSHSPASNVASRDPSLRHAPFLAAQL